MQMNVALFLGIGLLENRDGRSPSAARSAGKEIDPACVAEGESQSISRMRSDASTDWMKSGISRPAFTLTSSADSAALT